MGKIFIDIVVDEAIYKHFRKPVRFDGSEQITAKKSWRQATQYSFICCNVDSLKSLEDYIGAIRLYLEEEQFKKVNSITVHDRIMAKIIKGLKKKTGKEIIKKLKEDYEFEYFDLCSAGTDSRKVPEVKPIERDEYIGWEECEKGEIRDAIETSEVVSAFYDVYKDDDGVYFKKLVIEILIWLLPRYWKVRVDQEDRKSRFESIKEALFQYDHDEVSKWLASENEEAFLDALDELLSLESDEQSKYDEFIKNYETVISWCSRQDV